MMLPWILWLAVAQADGSGGIVLSGTTVDRDGSPVRQAYVCLAESRPLMGVRPRVLHEGRSEAGGRFQVPLVAEPEDRYRESRPYTLWAWAPGRAVAWCLVPRDLLAEPAAVRLVLGPAPALHVRVLHADGTPAAGVWVRPAGVSGRLLPEPLAEHLGARTDDRGEAGLAGLSADDVTSLRLRSDSVGTQQHVLPPAAPGTVPTVRLSRAGRVQGRLVASDPRAVRGLTLHVSTRADPSDDDWTGGFAEVVTDDDGKFAVAAIAEGTLTVRFVPHQDVPFRPEPAPLRRCKPGRPPPSRSH
jgi:hypothetical protein